MKFIKIFIVDFDQPLESNFSFEKKLNNIHIKFHDLIQGKLKSVYLFSAEKNNIDYSLTEKSISISKNVIEEITLTIENCINVISLSKHIGRTINSANPSIFLVHENENDYGVLSNAEKIEFDNPKLAYSNPIHKFDINFCFENLTDRFDGIRIFAEVYTAKTFSDKFREFFRLFEKAFNRSNRKLIIPMTKFLCQNSKLNYSQNEIENWVKIRNKTIHANHKEGFLINRDLYEIMSRIEQAAIDILFNKQYWNDSSITRESKYNFEKGILNENNQVFSLPNITYDISIMAFDETHTFPMSYSGGFKPENIPNEWWYEKKQIK